MYKNIILKFSLIMSFFAIIVIIVLAYNIRESSISQVLSQAKAISKILTSSSFKEHSSTGKLEDIDEFLNIYHQTDTIDDIWIVRSNNFIKQYGKNKFQHTTQDELSNKAISTGKIQYTIKESINTAKFKVSIPFLLNHREDKTCMSCHNINSIKEFTSISMILNMSNYKEYGMKIIITTFIMIFIFIVILIYILRNIINPYKNTINTLSNKIKLSSKGVFENVEFNSSYPEDSKQLIANFNKLSSDLKHIFIDIDEKLRSFMDEKTVTIEDANSLNDVRDVVVQLSLVYEFKKQIHLDNTKEEMYDRLCQIYRKQYNIQYLNIYEVDDNLNLTKQFQLGDKDYCIKNIINDPNKCRVYKNADDIYSLNYQKACNCFDNNTDLHYCIDIEVSQSSKLLFNFIFDSKNELEQFKKNVSYIKHFIKEISYEVSTKTLFEELENIALRDPLTALYNRQFLEGHLAKVLPMAKRENFNIGFLMLDMDHFKDVNDKYGHDIGDNVLISCANSVVDSIRASDVVIRFGGEEFIVLLVNIKTEEDILNIAEKIRLKIADTEIEVGSGSTIKKTVSIGMSMYPKDSTSFKKVMKYGDIALYEAKNSGRNKVVRYKEKIE